MSVETFTTAGASTWVAPAGVTTVQVECWGPGGNGGNGSSTGGGGGGGGGGYAIRNSMAVTPGNTYNYTVGSPGVSTVFTGDASVQCIGLSGNSGLNDGQGGGGGTGGGGTGDTVYTGGSGANQLSGIGGGGGGDAGTTGNGGNASGQTGGTGVNGGNGGNGGGFSVVGGNGTAPGGAAGGDGKNNSQLALGANGQIRLTYTAILKPTLVSPLLQAVQRAAVR